MSKSCIVCNKTYGWTTQMFDLADGRVCDNCLDKSKFSFRELMKLSTQTLNDVRDKVKGVVPGFPATKNISNKMLIDENTNRIMFPPMTIVDFREVVAFELLEDDETVTSGGLGRAAVGGALFGGAGAVVGAVTGKKKEKGTCNNLKIKVTLDNISRPIEYIKLIDQKTKKNKKEYKDAIDQAQECLSVLQIITERNK